MDSIPDGTRRLATDFSTAAVIDRMNVHTHDPVHMLAAKEADRLSVVAILKYLQSLQPITE